MARERTSSFTLPRHPFGSRRSRRPFSSARTNKPAPPTSTGNRSSTLPRQNSPLTDCTADFSSPSSPSSSDVYSTKRRRSFRHVGHKIFARVKASMSMSRTRTRSSSSDRSSTPGTVAVRRQQKSQSQVPSVTNRPSNGVSKFGLDGDQLRVYWFGEKTPGSVGLANHGNTCFMNAVLQCLSHTDRLAEDLALNRYKADVQQRKKKPGPGNRRGTDGELTEKLATVIKSLWNGQYSPAVSTEFKATVDKWGSQYKGGNQHDAQEFLLWLLDKVHEDLNVAKKRRYKHLKGSGSRADEIVAAESLHNFLRCNESFVHRLFQAQFRSSLTCPHCRCQSNTFDPFLCLSLPIPQAARRPIFVNVVFLSQQPRQVKLGLSMDCDASIGELRETIATDTGINIDRCVLAEVDGEGFRRTFSDHQSLDAIDASDRVHALYALELPESRDSSESDGEFVSIVFVNVLCPSLEKGEDGRKEEKKKKKKNDECTRFGSPYVTQLRREMSYVDFQKLMLKEMQAMVQPAILTTDQPVPLFRVEVYTGEREGEVLESDLDLPLYAEAVDQALSLSDPDGDGQYGPKHIKLVLRWEPSAKERVIFDDEEHVDNHESVAALEENPHIQPPVTLEQCFREYTSEEVLGTDNAWLCPSCNKKGKGIKKLALWSLPEILIIHLKRFKQWSSNGIASAKLATMVDFPKTNFDVSAHLAPVTERRPADQNGLSLASNHANVPDRGKPGTIGDGDGGAGKGMLQRMLRKVRPTSKSKTTTASAAALAMAKRRPRPEECAYELYAVCNHHGADDQGGHYTAYCKNSTDGKWFCFDDTHVSPLGEAEVVTEDAYVLFYCRKPPSSSRITSGAYDYDIEHGCSTLPLPVAKSPSGAGSMAGTLPSSWQLPAMRGRHWVYDIPGLRPVGKIMSREGGGRGGGSSGEEDSGVIVSHCSSDGLAGTSDCTDAQLSNGSTGESSEESPGSTTV